MTFAPESVYRTDCPNTLADLRQHADRYPEALASETADLARRLARPEAEVEAALEWLIEDGLELRA